MIDEDALSPDEAAMYEQATSWFYRTRIKHPPDAVEAIGLETGLAVADVKAWIAEAERVLSLTFPPDVEAEIQREVRKRLLRGPARKN